MKKIVFAIISILVVSCNVMKNNSESTSKQNSNVNTLLISGGNIFNPANSFPEFNWKVTPQYFMFGDGSKLLSDENVKSIAEKTSFICIEKNHAYRTLKYAEIGAKKEIAAFKAVNPNIKALYYFNSAYAWTFTSYNKDFEKHRIEEHPELKKFLLVDDETGELIHRRNIFCFDVLNPDFRAWWVKTVVDGVVFSGADGVFIDQMHGFVWLRRTQKKQVEIAMGEMMMNLKKALGPDKILLGNNASNVKDVYPAIDAGMFEHYSAKTLAKENILKEWGSMLKNAKAGKISIFRIGVEAEMYTSQNLEATVGLNRKQKEKELEQLSKHRLEYYQACFLIGAQPYSYLQYGWGWQLGTGPLVDYPDLYKPLGPPKAAYKRVFEDGWEFTREFENASVWVDLEKKQAKISWK